MRSRHDPARKVPKALRFTVLSRDHFTCQYCGRQGGSGVLLEVDHIVPFSQGGHTVKGNLITACEDCNRGKSARGHDCGQLHPSESNDAFVAATEGENFVFCDPYITALFGPLCE